jgi:hypothetical protein
MSTQPVSRRRHHRNRHRPHLVLAFDLSELIKHRWDDENQRLLIGGLLGTIRNHVTGNPTAPVADLDTLGRAQARRP